MEEIYNYLATLIKYSLDNQMIENEDVTYISNRLIAYFKLDKYVEAAPLDLSLEQTLDYLTSYAIKQGLIEESQVNKEIFIDELMNIFLDRPSNIISKFNSYLNEDPVKATDYFYSLNKASNYIKTYRVNKDLKWKSSTKYGDLDITINLSKPEKDPKDIAAARNAVKSTYPACLLCKENEGYKGSLTSPSRANIRLIPIKLDNEDFYFQYSPYSYYNEHSIILNEIHKPMIIDEGVFIKLLDFIEMFPHYFIGSNADLPIVGGSILSHEHFQAGRYHFLMEDAKSIFDFKLDKFNVNASILAWPLSVIRLHGKVKEDLVKASSFILESWIKYEDKEANIIAYTDGVRHNTITPIARKNKNNEFELDLVLRNNLTSEDYPLGIYHPHPEYHHLKKENIGLIEVMGLAILPSRLKKEIEIIKDVLLKKTNDTSSISAHLDWVTYLQNKYEFNEDNVEKIIQEEIGQRFALILEDSGVFKQSEEGIRFFKKFVTSLK